MADYVKKPIIYKRVQYTGDPAAFQAELQAESGSWWTWAVYTTGGEGDAVAARYYSNAQPAGFLEVLPSQYVVFRNGPEELPYLDYDGTSVVPA